MFSSGAQLLASSLEALLSFLPFPHGPHPLFPSSFFSSPPALPVAISGRRSCSAASGPELGAARVRRASRGTTRGAARLAAFFSTATKGALRVFSAADIMNPNEDEAPGGALEEDKSADLIPQRGR
ncbi:hypothetical protein BRADI_2g35547v3 [Brachypodium distachyon]|uniref:Uncharacterized protein n=1 Tax=Brachypodium distachyon TaxID=15368 RepID=A0A0Q3INL9_BRADI|nr:hypothetical protein BRADI_2g35547v3 [Brachypodium distachyon]